MCSREGSVYYYNINCSDMQDGSDPFLAPPPIHFLVEMALFKTESKNSF
jgi:hypothetical protein